MNRKNVIRALAEAQQEIRDLRNTNQILGAKVEMIDLFALVLHTKPAEQGRAMKVDIVGELERLELDLTQEEENEPRAAAHRQQV